MQNKVVRLILILLFSVFVIIPLALLGTCGIIGGVMTVVPSFSSAGYSQAGFGIVLIILGMLIFRLADYLYKRVRK